ncbi:putative gustatory receptor 77a [Drosophila serrata]|uniref:putative gustatory receptor 77a n=1 Tax=Drosophila serrata TaxID=7274 RepID=UPI000A1CFB6F|nr:putative gustatory receptor 77a [Drosophila serrata]
MQLPLAQSHSQLCFAQIAAMMPSWSVRLGHLILALLYSLTRVFGLMATGQSSPRGIERVRRSLYWRLHGWMMLIFVGVISPFAFLCIYHRMAFLRQNKLLLLIGFNRYVLLLACAFVAQWIHCFKQEKIIGCLNRLLRCRRQLRRLMHTQELRDSLDCLATRRHLMQLGLLLCSFIFSTIQPLQVLKDDPEVRRNLTYACCLVFILTCQLTLQLSLGMYTLSLLFLGHLVRHLNLLLERILTDVGCILEGSTSQAGYGANRQQLYRKQQQWLALELWQLLRVHQELLKLHRSISSLYGVQAVCFVAYVPMECMVHLFFTYFMKYSKFIIRKYGHGFPLNYYAIAFMTGLFTNLLLVILSTFHSERRFSCSREKLRCGSRTFPSGIITRELRNTLNYYGLYLKNVEYIFTVNACGLFKLNNILLFCIVQAMLNYLMILIQFDKVLNQ